MKSNVTAVLTAVLIVTVALGAGSAAAKHKGKNKHQCMDSPQQAVLNDFVTAKGYGRKPRARKKAKLQAKNQWAAVAKSRYPNKTYIWGYAAHKRIKCQKINLKFKNYSGESSPEYDVVCTATGLPCSSR